jgi:hypothetical protein
MSLNGSIDRITVQLQFEGGGDRDGISEQIDYAKERAPIHFESERELERRGKVPEALKKILEQQTAADQVLFTAKYLKPVKRQTEKPYQNLNSVMQTPVGAIHSGVQTFSSPDIWLAGQPVFVDEDGTPTPDGEIFRGIVIADQSTGPSIAAATQGTVPVRVQGPFETGDDIGIDSGVGQTAKKAGKLPLGKVNASYAGSEIVTVPVRLGAGSGGAAPPNISFILSDATVTEGDPPEVSNKVKIADGKINGAFPSGMGAGPDYILDLDDPADSIIYAIVTFNAATLEITSRALGSCAATAFPEPSIDDSGIGTFAFQLGFTYMDDTSGFTIVNSYVGDINFSLVYGAMNGLPALLPVARYTDWIPVPPPT